MSVKLNLHQISRPYKIEIFGLQDDFIGILQAYDDTFIGQVVEPDLLVRDDGTQSFSCKIPKYYYSEIPNEQVINPRWQDVRNGVIAENTRILKVTVQFSEDDIKVFPFMVNKISNRRDSNFSVYKEISCDSLAFSELGKLGYKLELNSHTLETDYAKDSNTLATIDYWLDKVFPNVKDDDGNIIKWLTPWCYEIRMDWRGWFEEETDDWVNGGTSSLFVLPTENFNTYNSRSSRNMVSDEEQHLWIYAGDSGPLYAIRDESKIYEPSYVSDWTIRNNKLTPVSIASFKEKARYIDCANSNKYNITQTIAETFEVFCTYEYECDSSGYFRGTYWDALGNVWTGKKVVFYNRAIKSENPITINYEHNLQSITRTADSTELYTKMYVNPVASETQEDGYVSIASTSLNPILDEFILNFDYLYSVGSITEAQKKEIEAYEVKLHQLNKQLMEKEERYNEITAELNNKEAERKTIENSLVGLREQLKNYERLRDTEVVDTPVQKDVSNPTYVVLVPQTNQNIIEGTFKLVGIELESIIGYSSLNRYTPEGQINNLVGSKIIVAQSAPSTADGNPDRWYVTLDEQGYPSTIFTSKDNPIFNEEKEKYFGKNFDINTGAVIYFSLRYCPKNKYINICDSLMSTINVEESKLTELKAIIGESDGDGLKGELSENEKEREELYATKEQLNFQLERNLGPALREGYWQPESYEDPGEGKTAQLSREEPNYEDVSYIYDEEPFDSEQLSYYNITEGTTKVQKYYRFIALDKINSAGVALYEKISAKPLEEFSILLKHPSYSFTLAPGSTFPKGNYYVLMDTKKYYYTLPYDIPSEKTITLHVGEGSAPYLTTDVQNGIITTTQEVSNPDDYANMTSRFGNNFGSHLSTIHLYNGSGFVFSFMKNSAGKIIPVALLIDPEINYEHYDNISFSFDKNASWENSWNANIEENIVTASNKPTYTMVYPRFFINMKNVNYTSDYLSVSVSKEELPTKLTKLDDYQVLVRKGKTYITLKVTNTNTLKDLFNSKYDLIYQITRADEMLYLDAKRVAKDSSKPKYSYEVSIANLPHELRYIELGQLVHINDYTVDCIKEKGYVSEIHYKLDEPSKDTMVVANYKTKFEDLFSSISAQNEAMKQNQSLYNIAAASFVPSGEIAEETMQTTLNNNTFIYNFTSSNMIIDDDGLIVSNKTAYNNGIYGQVAIRDGKIFCSSSVDDTTGDREWTTAITPEGINASVITTGRLDTNLIRIYSGNTLAFQWSHEGLFAYKETTIDEKPSLDSSNYIKFNEAGLVYVSEGSTALNLGWEGLQIFGADGRLKLTGADGLQMLNENGYPTVIFGKKDSEYGMFFTDGTKNQNVILSAVQNTGDITTQGSLLLSGMIRAGSGKNTAGMAGGNSSYRFWAGSSLPSSSSPFRVDSAGNVYAKNLNAASASTLSLMSNNDSLTTFNATVLTAEAYIYSPDIEADYLTVGEIYSGDIILQDGKLILKKGNKSAIISFDGEKINVEYK